MKYKALMLDLDGTTIPISEKGLPSKKVQDAIAKANKKLCVGIATSRPYFYMSYILDHLLLSAPCIINSSSEIIDPLTHSVLSQQTINEEDIVQIFEVAKSLNISVMVDFHDRHEEIKSVRMNLNKALSVYVPPVEESIADIFLQKISSISTIAAHKMPDTDSSKKQISINHVYATKQHGIFQVAKLLGIETHEIIGVGDGGNDFPLLMACGLKVAMGNAADDLKAIADYVAPTVEEDGVADVIEKFIT